MLLSILRSVANNHNLISFVMNEKYFNCILNHATKQLQSCLYYLCKRSTNYFATISSTDLKADTNAP